MNFPKRFADTLCSTCKLFPESQSHILQCPAIVPKLNMVPVQPCKLNVDNIYGSIDEQLKIAKSYTKISEVRNQILNESEQ